MVAWHLSNASFSNSAVPQDNLLIILLLGCGQGSMWLFQLSLGRHPISMSFCLYIIGRIMAPSFIHSFYSCCCHHKGMLYVCDGRCNLVGVVLLLRPTAACTVHPKINEEWTWQKTRWWSRRCRTDRSPRRTKKNLRILLGTIPVP